MSAVHVRESFAATVESGELVSSTAYRFKPDVVVLTVPARLELPDRHLWLYPADDGALGTLRVEFEAKEPTDPEALREQARALFDLADNLENPPAREGES